MRDEDAVFWVLVVGSLGIVAVTAAPIIASLILGFIGFMHGLGLAGRAVLAIVAFMASVIAGVLTKAALKALARRLGPFLDRSRKGILVCWSSSLGSKERLEPHGEINYMLGHIGKELKMKGIGFLALPTCEGRDDWSGQLEARALNRLRTFGLGKQRIWVMVVRSSKAAMAEGLDRSIGEGGGEDEG